MRRQRSASPPETESAEQAFSLRAARGRRLGRLWPRTVFPIVAAAVVLLVGLPAQALALNYHDVGSKQWAKTYIHWVTNQTSGGKNLLDDFSGVAFKPAQALTRAQLARALVMAAGREGEQFTPLDLSDVPATHAYYKEIQIALKLDLMSKIGDGFHPDAAVLVWQADRAVVLMLKLEHPRVDWRMLRRLDPVRWRPNDGWRPPATRYFPYEVAARYMGLRYNHPSASDKLEEFPTQAIRRDEAAYTFYQALHLSGWKLDGLQRFNDIVFPALSDRQKAIIGFALRYEGFPFVYAGEYPTPNSPYGHQAHGGFDCSGFVWWVMKIHFGYPIPVTQRSAAQMAAAAVPRIVRAHLQPCDPIFFAPDGPSSPPADVYHAALFLGNGWFINSTGSTDGVSLASIDWQGWSWSTDLAWGRRLLAPSDLGPTPTPTPTPSPSPSSR
jgi:cell wall-associated NlpC family hydrolase